MEIGGLPLHPLVVHAAVIFTPLAALLAIVFAVVPRWRWLSRWPAALAALAALGSVLLAKASGNALLEQRPNLASVVDVHEERGELLVWFVIGFFVLAAASVWMLGSTSPLPSGRGARPAPAPWVARLLPVLVVTSALGVMVMVALTGDAGSRAVWG